MGKYTVVPAQPNQWVITDRSGHTAEQVIAWLVCNTDDDEGPVPVLVGGPLWGGVQRVFDNKQDAEYATWRK